MRTLNPQALNKPPSKLTKILSILLITSLLSSCSTRWVYNQLDWLVPWYLSDYVSLEDYQEPAFDQALTNTLDWHRRSQLPLYSEQLQAIKASIKNGSIPSEFDDYYASFNNFISATFTQLGKEFVPLMADMNKQQVTELLANLAEKSKEYAAERVAIGEQASRVETKEKMHDFMQDTLGELTERQERLIDNWAKNKPWMAPHFYENRLAWQEHLANLLANQKPSQTELLNLFKQRDQHWSPQFKLQMQNQQLAMRDLLLNLVASLNNEQRTHVIENIERYISDFEYLSKQS